MADEIHALNKNEIQDIDYETYFGDSGYLCFFLAG